MTSVEKAKEYISGALAAMLDLGKGSGPMNHAFAIKVRILKYKGKRYITWIKKGHQYLVTV